jgi:hypothetical protein
MLPTYSGIRYAWRMIYAIHGQMASSVLGVGGVEAVDVPYCLCGFLGSDERRMPYVAESTVRRLAADGS